jgi:protein phosphatase
MANMVDDPEILQVVRHFPLSEVPQKLVDLANERGGDDNITVIAVQVQTESIVPRPAETGEHASV